MNIAVILTCHNRKAKTLRSLEALFLAQEKYNQKGGEPIALSIFLTDDGCTDGTADAVRQICGSRELTVITGDGNLYWAGGMRAAWREALKNHEQWTFYLLLNDDTYAFPTLFDSLMEAHAYSLDKLSKAGIYSAVTCSAADETKVTYGGDVFDGGGRLHRLAPTGKPQEVDIVNANVLMVSPQVVDEIGIFYDGYQHGVADNDYAFQARRHGLPCLITGQTCAYCEYDHRSEYDVTRQLARMTLSERKAYLTHPLHSEPDYLTYIRRNMPAKYPLTWLLRKTRMYLPMVYYYICKARGIKG